MWAGDDTAVLRALALLLPFADNDVVVPPLDTAGHYFSFLSLARTCRAAYKRLTNNAECWATQRLRINLSDTLFEKRVFVPREGAVSEAESRVLTRSRYTTRRAAILHRVFGHAKYTSVASPLVQRVKGTHGSWRA